MVPYIYFMRDKTCLLALNKIYNGDAKKSHSLMAKKFSNNCISVVTSAISVM